jgi:hypothetical protein
VVVILIRQPAEKDLFPVAVVVIPIRQLAERDLPALHETVIPTSEVAKEIETLYFVTLTNF